MSHDTALPGWLPGHEPTEAPNASGRWITRGALVERSTFTDPMVSTLVKSGRLTPHRAPANKRIQMFAVAEVEALFTPVPEAAPQDVV